MGATLIDRWLQGADSVPMLDVASLSLLRALVAEMAGRASLDAGATASIASAATELATNQLHHATAGTIGVRVVDVGGVLGVEVIAADRGPGIVDVAEALSGTTRSDTGLGVGLSAARRLTDAMDVDVRLGEGTCVTVRKLGPRAPRRAELGIYGAPAPLESISGDDVTCVRDGAILRLAIVDGLGHGPEARQASLAVVGAFLASHASLTDTLRVCDVAARPTRGAVATLLAIDEDAGTLEHLAAGNVITHVERPKGASRFTGRSTVLGSPRHQPAGVVETTPLGRRDILVVFTDGLLTRVTVEHELEVHHPAIIAQRLHERFARGNDDSTVVVVRWP